MNWRRIFRRTRRDAELMSEIEAHIGEETADNLARGMSPEEARRQAYLKFGNPQLLRERLWQQNSFVLFDGLWGDLKYAARTLMRSKGFSIMAILVMALGIGGTVAMFTVVRNVLLNPLPFPDSNRLYTLYEHENKEGFGPYLPVDAGSFNEWQRSAQGRAEMALVSPFQGYNVSSEGGKLPEKIEAAWCSWNLFHVFGVQPEIGRSFTAADDRADAAATVILSHAFWMRRYSGDRSVVGKNIYLDAKPYVVIGVLPESFSYSTGMSAGSSLQVWTPVNHEAWPGLMQEYGDHEFLVAARLAPGVQIAELLSQLDAVQRQIKATQPDPSVHPGVSGRSMLDDAVEEYETPLYAILAATGCVLLIACLNVASLLVARIAARSKEHAIRAALGGTRWRLLRERMTESLVLASTGGGLALLLAWGALRWLVNARPDMNRIETIHLDGFAFAFTVAAVLFAAVFSGAVSSLGASRTQVLAGLQESSRTHSGGSARATLRRVLLVAEVMLTVVLLVGAGLLLKSYQRLRTTDIGVPVENVLTLSVGLPEARYGNKEKPAAFFEQLITRVRALPGVQGAALVSRAPGQGWGGDGLLTVVEHPPLPKDVGLDLQRRAADPQYFKVIQLPLLEGRTFRDDERLDHARVAILSQSGAKLLFPNNEDPIGKHVKRNDDIYEIVGVVGDTRWLITQPVMPTWYMPIFGNDYNYATVVVRAPRHVESLAVPVQKIIGELDPDLPVFDVMTLEQSVGRSTAGSQFDSLLVLVFAGIALLLAAAGLYSVVAYLVTQRTSEIGIRIALGAKREQVLALIVADGLRPALIGLAAGLAVSAFAVRLIRSMLYQTQPLDGTVFVAATLTLLAMAALACLVPAWRASRLDPMQALRTE